MSDQCISIVLPVYNEADNIRPCLERLWAALQDYEHEILVCYDFDEDPTLSAIASMEVKLPTLRLIKNDLGSGVAYAIQAGLRAARGDVVVTTMADLSDPPEVIVGMVEQVRREGAAVVSGSRYMRGGSQTGGPYVKRTLSRFAGLSLHWVAGLPTHDATTNFRAYARTFLSQVRIESQHGFEVGLELTVKAHLQGLPIAEVPSSWTDRSAGQSRFQLWQWLPHYLRWYRTAMAAPLFVWGILVTLLLVTTSSVVRSSSSLVPLGAVALLGSVAVVSMLTARRFRGRMHYADALFPLAWIHPGVGHALVEDCFLPLLGLTALSCGVLLLLIRQCDRQTADPGVALSSSPFPSFRAMLLVGTVLWLSLLQVPRVLPPPYIDHSWMNALGYFYQHNLQAGVDYIFTYGPLGHFSTIAYDPALFWPKLYWEVSSKGLIVALLLGRCWDHRENFPRSCFLFLFFLLNPSVDVQYLFAMVLLTTLVLQHGDRLSAGVLSAATLVLAIVALVKFTFFLFSVICLLSIAAALFVQRSWLLAVGVLVIFTCELLLVWILCGQAPWNLFLYVSTSLQVASSYDEAMTIAYPDFGKDLAMVATILSLFTAAIVLTLMRKSRTVTDLLLIGVVAAGFFLFWKHSFVRPDRGHRAGFFIFSALAPFLLWRFCAPKNIFSTIARVCFSTCSLMSLAWFSVVFATGTPLPFATTTLANRIAALAANIKFLSSLPQMHQAFNQQLEEIRKKFDLPEIRAYVGQRSVDIISQDQAVLLLNGFNWRPRPVFQSYLTFTSELLKANADFLDSPRAPHFIIFQLQPLRGRFPTLDDSSVLWVLFHEYTSVLTGKSYLLLQRKEQSSSSSPLLQRVLKKSTHFGEIIDLDPEDGRSYALHLDVRYSRLGRLRKFFYKAPSLSLEVTLTDLRTARYTIIPGMVKSGFLLSPLLATQADVIGWYNHAGLRRVRSFRVLTDGPQSLKYFQPEITVELRARPRDEPLMSPQPLLVPTP